MIAWVICQTVIYTECCFWVITPCSLLLHWWCFLQDSSGIFWDNDSLAALLALELKADLLVLLSDVEGLYSGPPGEPQSKIIHTYIKERHQGEITFGDKSRVGRGGMTAKVKSAVYAASAGTPVIITRYVNIVVKLHVCYQITRHTWYLKVLIHSLNLQTWLKKEKK